MGSPGPDLGKGGKYFILRPDYEGDNEGPIGRKAAVAKGQKYFVAKSTSYVNLLALRGFLVDGKTDAAVAMFRTASASIRLGRPPTHRGWSSSASPKMLSTIHANNYESYE